MMVWKKVESLGEGWFHDDKRSGYGRAMWKKGDFYEGEFSNNLMDGLGNCILSYISYRIIHVFQW